MITANTKPVVMAVDDSPSILQVVSAVLSDEYKVITLVKPLTMKSILQKVKPDLFLLDFRMPEISGIDLLHVIRGFEEHKDTPIIFLTSAGTIDNVTASIALGVRDFVVKPFDPDVLRAKIRKQILCKKDGMQAACF